MTSTARKLKQEALKLSETDRLALALALWESMPESDPEVGPDEAAYAVKRLAEHLSAPDETLTWAESKRRMAKTAHQRNQTRARCVSGGTVRADRSFAIAAGPSFHRLFTSAMMERMTSTARKLKQEALKLSETDRLALALALWESMPESDPEVGPDEADYAVKRLAEHLSAPDETLTWAESKRRMAKTAHQRNQTRARCVSGGTVKMGPSRRLRSGL